MTDFAGVESNVIDWSGKDRPSARGDCFNIQYRPVRRTSGNYHEEFLNACAELRGRDVRLHYSGGMDSEFLAYGLREAGVPFRLIFFRYQNHLPSEIASAESYAAATGLPLEMVLFDELQFLSKGLPEFMEQYRLSEPFSAFEMRRMELTEGFPVLGAGDVVLINESGKLTAQETGSHHLIRVFVNDRKISSRPHFLQSTPELVSSFLQHPIIAEWKRLAIQFQIPNSRFFKEYVYRDLFPKMPERKKWTGYEKFGDLYMEARKIVNERGAIERDRCLIPLERVEFELSLA